MKIVYVSTGNFIHTRPYINYSTSRGHQVCWFTFAQPIYGTHTTIYDFSYGTNLHHGSCKLRYFISVLPMLRALKRIKPDVVHFHYATSAGLLSLFFGGYKTVLTAHGSDLVEGSQSKVFRIILRKVFKRISFLNVVSDDLKRIALELDCPECKIVVANVGIDEVQFAFKSRSRFDLPLKLVCTRRLAPIYDHTVILKALKKLKDSDIDFKMVFVGYDELGGALRKMASELDIMDSIEFKGGCHNSKIVDYLHDADIYLSASKSDGTSLCLLEAMATGIFPIVSDIPANSAWIKNGKNGYLHEVGNAEMLADQIMLASENKRIMSEAAVYNRELVEEKGSRQGNMKKIEDIYKKLAGSCEA